MYKHAMKLTLQIIIMPSKCFTFLHDCKFKEIPIPVGLALYWTIIWWYCHYCANWSKNHWREKNSLIRRQKILGYKSCMKAWISSMKHIFCASSLWIYASCHTLAASKQIICTLVIKEMYLSFYLPKGNKN